LFQLDDEEKPLLGKWFSPEKLSFKLREFQNLNGSGILGEIPLLNHRGGGDQPAVWSL